MLRGGDEVLTAEERRSPGLPAPVDIPTDPVRAPEPKPAPAPIVAARKPRLAQDRDAVVGKIDETLGVIGEILDLLRQRSPRGSQARIFVEAAAVATTRARALAQSLTEPEAGLTAPTKGD